MSEIGTIKVVSGFVWWTGSTTFGNKELFSFKFDGKDDFYRQGTERYEGVIDKGNYIKAEVEAKVTGKGVEYWEVKRVKVVEAPAEAVEEQKESVKKKSGAKKGEYARNQKSKNDYWEKKDEFYKEHEIPALRYNAARTAAMTWVPILVANEAIKLPAKTKTEERRTVLDGLLDFYTAKFNEDALDQKALSRVAEALEPAVEEADPMDAAIDAESGGSEFDDD